MLNQNCQSISFDQFLFSNFDLRKEIKAVFETDSCDVPKPTLVKKKIVKKKVVEIQPAVLTTEKPLIKKAVSKKKLAKKDDYLLTSDEALEKLSRVEESPRIVSSLVDAIDSIPDKVRAIDIEALAHKHESEWYHAFRDIKEELVKEISKKHPNHKLQSKSEIKEFWVQLDEHIERIILELERIFQNFPNMARVAVIYLVSLIIAVPLVFITGTKNFEISSVPIIDNNVAVEKVIANPFTKEMKSDYVAKHSQEILSSGQITSRVSLAKKSGRVAGAYEEKDETAKGEALRQKISACYRFIKETKEDLDAFVNAKLK